MKTNDFSEEYIETDEELNARFVKMNVLPRGTFTPQKGATDSKKCKSRVSLLLDADVLEFFKENAAKLGNLPYQTQINQELRKAMEIAKKPNSEVVTIEMLENPQFLANLASKLKLAA
jgi:uncharacterized protein (DUF4415 family)